MSRCSKGFLVLLFFFLFCERKEYLNSYDPINLPPAPYLIEPQNDSTSVENPPHFYWDIIEDTLNPFFGDPLVYELRADTTETFSDPVYSITNIANTSLWPYHLFGDNTYYWQTRARYVDGGWSAWSPAWKFDVQFPLIASCAVTATGDMATAHDRVYMVSNGDLAIINASNPYSPYLVQIYQDSAVTFTHIFVSGQYLYATDYSNNGNLTVFSLANPDQPSYISYLSLYYPGDLWIENNRAYVLCSEYPVVIDIINADSLVIIDTLPGNGYHIVIDNDHAYVSSYYIYIINLPSGTVTAVIQTNTNGLYVNDHYLFVAGYPTKIYDISNPANPVHVSNIEQTSNYLIVSDNYLFLSNNEDLHFYDISTISEPTYIGICRILRGPFCINGAYLCTGYPEYSVVKYE